ncbi:MAG TPA: hypothetical protein VGG25_25465 [Streptosporangiaceae bacterium]
MAERGTAIGIPDAVRRKAVTAGATGWLHDLPGLIADRTACSPRRNASWAC